MHSFVYSAIFSLTCLRSYTHLASPCKKKKKNYLILPQPTSELRKTVTRLEALKFRTKAGGMLERIQTVLAHQQGDERKFQLEL